MGVAMPDGVTAGDIPCEKTDEGSASTSTNVTSTMAAIIYSIPLHHIGQNMALSQLSVDSAYLSSRYHCPHSESLATAGCSP